MLSFFNRVIFSSLARQLIFGIAAVHAVLMTIFVFDLVDRQREFMLFQNHQQAVGLAATLATNGSSWVLANDLVGIEEIISSQSNYPDLKYAMFIDLHGKVLGFSDRTKTGMYIDDEISHKIFDGSDDVKIIHESSDLIDVASPVLVSDKVIGWARVGISRKSMANNLSLVTKNGLLYTIVAIVVGVLFAWIMANGLSKGIRKLKFAIDLISNGSRDVSCELNRHDELEDLAQDFNKMLITLNERETKIHEAHDALIVSETKISNLIDNLRTEYIFYSHNTEGAFTYLSPSITDVLGYSSEEYMQGNYDAFFTDNPINEKAIKITEHVLSGGTTSSYDVEVFHKDGRRRLMEVTESAVKDANGNVTAVEGLARDITELKQASIKLQEEKEKFEREKLLLKSIIDAIPDQIYYKDSNGHFLGSNKSFNNEIGLTSEQMLNKTDADIFSDTQALEIKNIEEEITRTKQQVNVEESMTDSNGKQRIFDNVYTTFAKENGDVLGYIRISKDISAMRNQETQLRQSQRLDALGKLTGGIAHDYNNLLGVVIGYAELLSISIQDEKLRVFSDEIMKAGKRGANLTKKLLAFTKTQSPSASVVNINNLLTADYNMLQKTLTARIDVKYNLDPLLWSVWIDSGDFQDSILNMCINAMHAMPDGGELVVTSENVTLPFYEASVRNLHTGDYVKVSISDTGCGMDEAVQDQLFDPFFTTKGEKGSGLGLSQVFGFVKRSGGHIEIDSEPGRGSTFSLYFKRYKSEAEDEAGTDAVVVRAAGHGQTILVVDDEFALADMAAHILKDNGYNVSAVNSAKDALQYLESNSVDLVLSDVIMPDIDGYELATMIRENFPEVKIVLASGYIRSISKKPEHIELTNRILQKPYTSEELIGAVTKQLNVQSNE